MLKLKKNAISINLTALKCNITDEETVIFKKYIKCEMSRRELWECQFTFFTVNYTMIFFSLLKTVNLTLFYSKIT